MNILMNIIAFIIGFVLGVFIRNILEKIIKTRNIIKRAEQIIEEENKRKQFKEKFDIEIDEK